MGFFVAMIVRLESPALLLTPLLVAAAMFVVVRMRKGARVPWPVPAAGLLLSGLLALAGAVPATTSAAPGTVSRARQVGLGSGGASAPERLGGTARAPLETPGGFAIRRRRGLLTASGGGLSVSFGASGVSVGAGGTQVSLSLLGWGRADAPLGGGRYTTPPRADLNRVSYGHRGLTEWYAIGPAGLEQGFTVPARPAWATHGGPLIVEEKVSGALRPKAVGPAVVLARTSGSAPVLRYGGLRATDAAGRPLPAHLEVEGSRLLLVIADAGASYPVTIDPLVQQAAKLTGGAQETGAGHLGASVALSADGNTAVVGAPNDGGGVGAAYVYVRAGATWSLQAKLTPRSGEEDGAGKFGSAVAISADGNTVLVGAPSDTGSVDSEALPGAAWIFTRSSFSAGDWAEPAGSSKLVPPDEACVDVGFGSSVALSADGGVALIGGPDDLDGAGAAWVYAGANGVLAERTKLVAGDSAAGNFGASVALSANGTTGLVGDPYDASPYNADGSGTAWLFYGTNLTSSGPELLGDPIDVGTFGTSVALSGDGHTALVGDPQDSARDGAAWVFTGAGVSWTQPGTKLTDATPTAGEQFGSGVALSSDGATALIGAPVPSGPDAIFAADEFTNGGSGWSQGATLSPNDANGPELSGTSVALSADATTALLGGPDDASDLGAAWPFASGPVVSSGAASNISAVAATLSGTVDPNGADTSYEIQYGTTAAYGQQTSSVNIGLTGQAVSQTVAGLQPGTTYHFRVVATNADGETDGADLVFTTAQAAAAATPTASPPGPPLVSAGSVQTVDGNAATLDATIDPNGSDTSYEIQYGSTSAYGSTTTPVPIGAGPGPQSVSETISGLAPSANYHFRFVATNANGTTDGADESFVTTTGGTGPTGGLVPAPAEDTSADLLPYLGTVLVDGEPLLVGEQIPFGETIDATDGTVVLETQLDGVTQAMDFAGGDFEVQQLASGTTELVLEGGTDEACAIRGSRTTRVLENARTIRSLWGNGHGVYEVKGNYAAATVRGTIFHVVDRCDGTFVHVVRGVVAVLDLASGKTLDVFAGHSDLVQPGQAGSKKLPRIGLERPAANAG